MSENNYCIPQMNDARGVVAKNLFGTWVGCWLQNETADGYWVQFSSDAPFRKVSEIRELYNNYFIYKVEKCGASSSIYIVRFSSLDGKVPSYVRYDLDQMVFLDKLDFLNKINNLKMIEELCSIISEQEESVTMNKIPTYQEVLANKDFQSSLEEEINKVCNSIFKGNWNLNIPRAFAEKIQSMLEDKGWIIKLGISNYDTVYISIYPNLNRS